MGLIEIVLAGLCFNATCPEDEGHQISFKQQRFAKLAEELKSETLRITTISNGELSGYLKADNEFIGKGTAFDIVRILQRKYNFQYVVIPPDEDAFLSSGSKKGAKDMVESNQVDMVAAFLPIIHSFRNDITYSRSFDTAEWVVMMRRPKESATGSGLLAPFTTPVWILIILSLLVVGPIIYFLVLIGARLCRDEHYKVFPLPSCMWFVYGALLKQGSTLNPVTDSSRLLFSTWWIFITILTAFYTANLTAFLTLSKFTLPISDPSDIKHYKYKWATGTSNGINDYLAVESREAVPRGIVKLGDKIGNSSAVGNDRDILKYQVSKRGMMFIREKSVVNHLMYSDYKDKARRGEVESKRCTYVVAKFAITTFPRAFSYSKGFKYKELFDSTIQHLVESGIIKYKLDENLPSTEICPLNLGNTERRLRNSDLILTYLIVGGGLAVAGLIFLLELLLKLWWWKMKGDQKPRRPPKHKALDGTTHHNNNNHHFKNGYVENVTMFTPPPPSYHTLFQPPFVFTNPNCRVKNINGRDYWVINKKSGPKELIPLRTPSALLFQYSN